jgi:hypothetical protein
MCKKEIGNNQLYNWRHTKDQARIKGLVGPRHFVTTDPAKDQFFSLSSISNLVGLALEARFVKFHCQTVDILSLKMPRFFKS